MSVTGSAAGAPDQPRAPCLQLKHLERVLEKAAARARPYFEQREVVQQELLRQKAAIQQLQRALGAAKARYSASLRELESISEQIHQRRRLR